VIDHVGSRGSTAQTPGIRIDHVVSGRPEDRSGLLSDALAMFQMTRILDRNLLTAARQRRQTPIGDWFRHDLRDISHLVADLRIGLEVGPAAGNIHDNDICISKRYSVLEPHLVGFIDESVMSSESPTTGLTRRSVYAVSGCKEDLNRCLVYVGEPRVRYAADEDSRRLSIVWTPAPTARGGLGKRDRAETPARHTKTLSESNSDCTAPQKKWRCRCRGGGETAKGGAGRRYQRRNLCRCTPDDLAERHERWAGGFTGTTLQAEIDDLTETLIDFCNTLVNGIDRRKPASWRCCLVACQSVRGAHG
jgi:hypothetical protein